MSARPAHRRPPGPAQLGAGLAVAAVLALTVSLPLRALTAPARPLVVRVGVSLALTGPDARYGLPMLHGVELAVEDVNQRGTTEGYALETVVLDSAGPGLEGISRWRGMNNYERFIADPTVVAAVGPQTTGEARAAAPLLSRADLAIITPSATTFDVTDPANRDRFRPGGHTVFFRTVGTDLAQGDAMARFAHTRLGVRRVVLVEDGSAFGGRLTGAFERRAVRLGITILARRLLNWQDVDYRDEMRELSTLRPDALYAGVRLAVGVKLARGLSEALPDVWLLGTETLYDRAFPLQSRGDRAEGWYVSNVSPDPAMSPAATAWAARYRARFGAEPSGYALSAYTAVTVIADAINRVARRGRPVTRASVRETIATTRLPDAPSGPVSFNRDGDLERPVVSIYQVRDGTFRHVETVAADDIKGTDTAGAR